MAEAMVSEFLIALFAGLILYSMVRRRTPLAVELALWIGLVWSCIFGITNAHDAPARALTSAAVWGSSQMVGTMAWLAEQSAMQWLFDRRFVIADWVVLLFGVDLLVLTLLVSRRQAQGWQPRIRLGGWMELPPLGRESVSAATTAVSAVEEVNQRVGLWARTRLTLLLIWTGDVVLPTARRKLRGAALRAEPARRRIAATVVEMSGREPQGSTSQVVDLVALSRRASAASVRAAGWFTERGASPQMYWIGGHVVPPEADRGNDVDDAQQQQRDRRDRLAS